MEQPILPSSPDPLDSPPDALNCLRLADDRLQARVAIQRVHLLVVSLAQKLKHIGEFEDAVVDGQRSVNQVRAQGLGSLCHF